MTIDELIEQHLKSLALNVWPELKAGQIRVDIATGSFEYPGGLRRDGYGVPSIGKETLTALLIVDSVSFPDRFGLVRELALKNITLGSAPDEFTTEQRYVRCQRHDYAEKTKHKAVAFTITYTHDVR